MFKASIDVDSAKLQATLEYLGATEFYAELASAFAFEIEDSVKANTPFKTGDTRRKWHHDPPLGSQVLERRVFNESKIAVFLEEGTRPHDIEPKNKKALAWEISRSDLRQLGVSPGEASSFGISARQRTKSKTTGKDLARAKTEFFVLSRRVHHPGTRAVKMLENTLVTLQPWIEQEMRSAVEKLWAGGPPSA